MVFATFDFYFSWVLIAFSLSFDIIASAPPPSWKNFLFSGRVVAEVRFCFFGRGVGGRGGGPASMGKVGGGRWLDGSVLGWDGEVEVWREGGWCGVCV